MQNYLKRTHSFQSKLLKREFKFFTKITLTPKIFKDLLDKEIDFAYTTNLNTKPIRLFDYLKYPYKRTLYVEEEYIPDKDDNTDKPVIKNTSKLRLFTALITLLTLGYYGLYMVFSLKKSLGVLDGVVEPNLIKKEYNKKHTYTLLKDIKGIDEILPEFEELLGYMQNPENYNKMGAKIPKGILLTGPPGVGKTFLAKALANESSWNFIYKSGSEFDDKYVGEGARKVRELFQEAKQSKPAIIFIDELDSVAGKREYDFGYSSQTINQLLTEMDGFSTEDDILIIGATNLEESLDKAVLRPGRFDKIINVPLPTRKGRKDILELYINKILHEKNIDIDKFAKRTVGMSPADLRNLVNTAAIHAVKLNHKATTEEDLDYAYDRILMGIKSSNKGFGFTKNDIKSVAIHEIGHTLAAMWNDAAMDVHKVTVLSVGGSLGSTSLVPKVEEENLSKRNVIAQLDVALGGRIAEEVFLGEDKITTGCSDDMSKATKIAYEYFASYGLDEENFLAFDDLKKLSEDQRYKIEKKVNNLLNERYSVVRKQFEENKPLFLRIVDQLVEKETLSRQEIVDMLKN